MIAKFLPSTFPKTAAIFGHSSVLGQVNFARKKHPLDQELKVNDEMNDTLKALATIVFSLNICALI